MSRLTLRGTDLAALQAQVLDEHGPSARIISAERVTQGGIAGVLARKYFELTVELDDGLDEWDTPIAPVAPSPTAPLPAWPQNRAGIAALLDMAEAADDTPRVLHGPPAPEASTDFDAVLARMTSSAGLPPQESPTPDDPGVVAVPESAPGDLVLVVGLGDDALRVAHSLAGIGTKSDVRVGGILMISDSDPVVDRRTALGARAEAVNADRAVVVAFGLSPDLDAMSVENLTALLAPLGADWVWAVVDVSRKPQDTERWVAALRGAVGVGALAVVGSEFTATPHTASMLNIPVGWADGEATVVTP
jgi:hypothetical protein